APLLRSHAGVLATTEQRAPARRGVPAATAAAERAGRRRRPAALGLRLARGRRGTAARGAGAGALAARAVRRAGARGAHAPRSLGRPGRGGRRLLRLEPLATPPLRADCLPAACRARRAPRGGLGTRAGLVA